MLNGFSLPQKVHSSTGRKCIFTLSFQQKVPETVLQKVQGMKISTIYSGVALRETTASLSRSPHLEGTKP